MATATTYKPINWIFFRGTNVTFWAQSESFRIRAHSVPADPKTADQTASRGAFSAAKKLWSTLSPGDKKKWSEFALENLRTNKREHPVKWRGVDAFTRASMMRQTAGLDPMPGLPQGAPPQEPTALDLLPGSDPRELVFRIEHQISNLDGHAMMVRMTPTGKSRACSPYKSSLRHVRGVGKQSVIALPASGEVVRIANTRFELVPCHKYAIEVRIIRLEDGAASLPRYHAAAREETPPAIAQDETRQPCETSQSDSGGDQTVATVPEQPTRLAAARGSQYFPSAYVQYKYFRDP